MSEDKLVLGVWRECTHITNLLVSCRQKIARLVCTVSSCRPLPLYAVLTHPRTCSDAIAIGPDAGELASALRPKNARMESRKSVRRGQRSPAVRAALPPGYGAQRPLLVDGSLMRRVDSAQRLV